eukprot:5697268-Amphidinium_carterae.1
MRSAQPPSQLSLLRTLVKGRVGSTAHMALGSTSSCEEMVCPGQQSRLVRAYHGVQRSLDVNSG